MDFTYQLIFLGAWNGWQKEIETIFRARISELGVAPEHISILTSANFDEQYRANAPAFCIYFGAVTAAYPDLEKVGRLLASAKTIVPVVDDLKAFNQQIPQELRAINGYALDGTANIEALVSLALENLSLLRTSRRLFISYRRDESTAAAIQLFERLEKAGFDVFLDTYSIRPGEPFQDELWQRLADTDVVILLNTPDLLVSQWTEKELAKANTMAVGILQLVWPNNADLRYAELTVAETLSQADFGTTDPRSKQGQLTNDCLDRTVGLAESLRARSLAARQSNMISEFSMAAKNLGIPVSVQPGKFLLVDRGPGRQLIMIPTVGVPQAFTYHQSEEMAKTIRTKEVSGVYLLYDHLNIRDKWVKHLDWLDGYLEIKSLKLLETEAKLAGLK
ncbi:toll/interleukin-1 receptor domain-containing protein [Mucilaginibacter sp.]|uniref:toll/interleukin-1 receptor domain-containing protein n=1 Tax=Mucilaginibacter sp. TaxID=1882438 RepID=UPI00261ADE12|nr:toll/interleukin-1 receptor domain-containing protein [Mucilaginibacter sp.]MDB4922907.1 toll/interleukin receptor protein [Mucilaginibacter sp.]